MTETTRDSIDIREELSGPIDDVIARLTELKAKYPDGEIEITTETEYGEVYERAYLNFTRDKTPLEIEYTKVSGQMHLLRKLRIEEAAFNNNGAEYPRADEIKSLEEELGAFSKNGFGDLQIFDNELVLYDFTGAVKRDGTVAFRVL